jgi:hypothetical protein
MPRNALARLAIAAFAAVAVVTAVSVFGGGGDETHGQTPDGTATAVTTPAADMTPTRTAQTPSAGGGATTPGTTPTPGAGGSPTLPSTGDGAGSEAGGLLWLALGAVVIGAAGAIAIAGARRRA